MLGPSEPQHMGQVVTKPFVHHLCCWSWWFVFLNPGASPGAFAKGCGEGEQGVEAEPAEGDGFKDILGQDGTRKGGRRAVGG